MCQGGKNKCKNLVMKIQTPLFLQIRMSNLLALRAALEKLKLAWAWLEAKYDTGARNL